MKATCDREKLLQAFQAVANVAPARSPKPILQNVKLEATAETAIVMATDLEVGMRVVVPGVEVEVPGDIVLPISRFGSILRESSDVKLALENDGQSTTVRGEHCEFHLPSENPDQFPSVAAFDANQFYELPTRFYRQLVRRTVFATDAESTHYALAGVLLELTAERVTAVATDGRRLSRQEGPIKTVGMDAPQEASSIVPTRTLQLLERAISDDDATVQLAVDTNDIRLKSGRVTVYSGLVQGRYPNWRDVLPRRDEMVTIPLTVGAFHAAVRQAAIVTSEERRGVEFTFGAGKVVLAGHGAELGESQVELPIEYDGPELPVTLDPRYLNDFLRVLDPQQSFQMELRNSESAVVCWTEDDYTYVVMPLARDQTA